MTTTAQWWWQRESLVERPDELFAAAVAEKELDLPLPGEGDTVGRLDALAALGAFDPVAARLGESHADAVAILAELGGPAPGDHRWGVWAASPGSLTATRDGTGWRVDGKRSGCSGAGVCTRALVTAAAPDGIRLFAVGNPGTAVHGSGPAVGMAGSDSRTVVFTAVAAEPVGGPERYVDRPGFWHGAIGVAACWHGGAVGVARTLWRAAREHTGDPHLLAHLGAVDARLTAAKALLHHAGDRIDDDPYEDLRVLAGESRAVVEATATEVLDRVGRALGADPLCRNARYARRAADLTVYLRQSRAERDLAGLGERVAARDDPAW